MLCHVVLYVSVIGIIWGDSQRLIVSVRMVSVWHCMPCVTKKAVLWCGVVAVYVTIVCIGNFCACDCVPVFMGWHCRMGTLHGGIACVVVYIIGCCL